MGRPKHTDVAMSLTVPCTSCADVTRIVPACVSARSTLLLPSPGARLEQRSTSVSSALPVENISNYLSTEFVDTEGTVNIDCDLNVPTLPCKTKYDGGIEDIVKYLEQARPVGWVEELSKLQDMSASFAKPKKSWSVKFRRISPNVVLPRQVSNL